MAKTKLADGVKGEEKTHWTLRFERAAQRERLRAFAVEALKSVRPAKMMTWAMLAQALNRKKVRNHLGHVWNGPMVSGFVRIHEAMTGVRLVPWMGEAGSRRGALRLVAGRKAYLLRRRRLREERADAIRKYCVAAKTYSEGVRVLNVRGIRTQSGRWTVVRLGDFVRRYREQTGEKLMPLVELKPGLQTGGRRLNGLRE
ncbi:MAG: hypothetical protein K2Y42_06635 [Hyphomicrobium sp.]|jgi:hypothetical protein|uniref:hypothetical protein n=1 Tax=Hyphomicrobium sp. TaxID=82 RepID=UPI0025BAE394|nr:hypothetical protein [Hyphomicrobium sp.]MBX9862414.1 hypothetical protein [Hyphomicrobium sp.]